MKKYQLIVLLILSVFFVSCEDYLDTYSPSKYDNITVYRSASNAEDVLMGVYAMSADANMYAQRVSLNWSTNSDIEFVGADETSYNQTTNRGVSNYYSTTGNSVLTWTNIYRMIERANLLIEGIKQSPVLEEEENGRRMKMILGEALTLRAMAYYELVKHWGDVPFKTEPTLPDLSNVYLGKTDRDTIYDHIIADLLEAEQYVPWIGEQGYTVERITKGFIKGMTARISLSAGGYSLRDKPGFPMERRSDWRKFYTLANTKTREIMEKGVHQLNPSYLNVWKNLNSLKFETTYNENLYEVALGLGQNGEMGYSVGVRFYANPKYGYGNNANVVNTSVYYFYSFDQKDSRRDITVAKAMYSNSAGETKEVFQTNPLSFNIGKWDQRWMSQAWLALNLAANGKIGYGINWSVMRYSDVLLMFAETENELNGPTSEAKEALRKVRQRAFAPADYADKVENYLATLNSKETFFEAIVNERAWEFGGEAVRKFDLIRWNMLQDKIEEQRQKFVAMLNGEVVTVFGQTYSSLPLAIYYKYQADNENIDWADINFFDDRPDLDAKTTDELKALGYTKVSWLFGASESNKTNWNLRIELFGSGLEKAYNGVCDNRYLYPIHSVAISDSQGKLTNSYGY
jgi:hypothetical protein